MARMKEPAKSALAELRAEEASCTRCTLYKLATQVVPGEGRAHSRLMLVGEQPGDKEDLAGRPFVGPAGRRSRLPMARPHSSPSSLPRCCGSRMRTSGGNCFSRSWPTCARWRRRLGRPEGRLGKTHLRFS